MTDNPSDPSANRRLAMLIGGLAGAALFALMLTVALLRAGRPAFANNGELEVSLSWSSLSDLDLELRDPSGELITAQHRQSASGGMMDVDANPTPVTAEGKARADAGMNPGTENLLPLPTEQLDRPGQPGSGLLFSPGFGDFAPSRFTRTPVERISFERAPQGSYTVYAHCYSWREADQQPIPYTVRVRTRNGEIQEIKGLLGPSNFAADGVAPSEVFTFVVP